MDLHQTVWPLLMVGVTFTIGLDMILAVAVEFFEKDFLGGIARVEGKETDFFSFRHMADWRATANVVGEALHVIERDFEVGERMLWVLAMPFLVVPGTHEIDGDVVAAGAFLLEEKTMGPAIFAREQPHWHGFVEWNTHR